MGSNTSIDSLDDSASWQRSGGRPSTAASSINAASPSQANTPPVQDNSHGETTDIHRSSIHEVPRRNVAWTFFLRSLLSPLRHPPPRPSSASGVSPIAAVRPPPRPRPSRPASATAPPPPRLPSPVDLESASAATTPLPLRVRVLAGATAGAAKARSRWAGAAAAPPPRSRTRASSSSTRSGHRPVAFVFAVPRIEHRIQPSLVDSGEGYITVDGNTGDRIRMNITLWHGGEALIAATAAACANTIVVQHVVGPMLVTD
ncbi:hypothetical protein B0H11DRAFT_2427790 [Mycena galericulata]|nr:hypothetical protein B0H11DRAFT_2427790 [Mycena galericulata]